MVGAGYSFALNGVMTAYNGILNHSGMKPNVVSLDGWAGTQRYAGIGLVTSLGDNGNIFVSIFQHI